MSCRVPERLKNEKAGLFILDLTSSFYHDSPEILKKIRGSSSAQNAS